MIPSTQPSWADKIEGMIDPHLHVSPQMFRQLKEEAAKLEGFPEVFPFYRRGIPIHVEKALPFLDDEGQEVRLVAVDHDFFRLKAEPMQPHEPPKLRSQKFDYGLWDLFRSR